MKKITLLTFIILANVVFAQTKSTGVINLQPNMTANLTLNNNTGKVGLVLTGPSDRWFGFGIGVTPGFSMGAGDVLVYTTNTVPPLSDRKYIGTQEPEIDVSQDWTIVSNNVSGTVRTLNLIRNLTTTDTAGQDFQMPYASTNSLSIVGVRAGSATFNIGSHGGLGSAGYQTATFTTLGTEDFSLNATKIFPNPTKGTFNIQTTTKLSSINIYSQVGQFIKSIDVTDLSDNVAVEVKDLATGIYLLELKNDSEKSWKKVIVE